MKKKLDHPTRGSQTTFSVTAGGMIQLFSIPRYYRFKIDCIIRCICSSALRW